MQTDDRPDDPFYVPLPDDDRTDDPFYVPLPDGSLFDYDITVTLPHDNLYSPCFIDCFDNAVPGDIDYSGIWCGTAEDGDESVQKLSRHITTGLRLILKKDIRVRIVPTFGEKVASRVDISKKVCFDFDYDAVLATLDDGETDVDCVSEITNVLRLAKDPFRHLLHAVDKVVNLPVVLSADDYSDAIRRSFQKACNMFESASKFRECRADVDLALRYMCETCDRCLECISDISSLPSAQAVYKVRKDGQYRLQLQFQNYLKQRPPFNGYMFVRQDKIPDQLKLCSVRILRRRMVRYLSNAANFTRIGDNDETVLAALRTFISSFLQHLQHTVLDDTWNIWNFELLARVLDRDKPKGGSRPVCNNQNVVTTLLDKLCACTTTACLGIIEAHVRSLQTTIGSDQNMPLHMMWSIRNIQHFVDLIPTNPIPRILHDHNALVPTSVFSDVSGCFNNVPQGYPRSPSEPPEPEAANAPPTVQISSLLDDIQRYCDTACDTLPAHGCETLELMCDAQDVSFHKKTVIALSQLLDGWHSDIFINRDKLDIRMYQDAMITKAFHCRSVLSGVKYEDVVLQIRIRDDDVRVVGWDSIERIQHLQAKDANAPKLRSCVFLDHRSAKQILAVLIMSQTLRVGNAVVLSLLGVMQGSYSGAQSINGILTVSEIGFCISMLVSRFKWVLPYYALTTRYVDDSAFLTNPFASWLLPLVYPIQGLKFTVDVVQADSERREYLGIHVTMTSPADGWYSMHTAWYAKKHSIPEKYGLDFSLKPSFLCLERPIASSKGLIAGDVFRLIQACSNTGVFFVSIQRRVAYLSDEVLISTKFILQQIIGILSNRMHSLVERFQWHNEPAALAAADLFFRQLLTCIHPMTKLVPDCVSTATAGHRKLMSSLFRHHQLRRSQYPPANPAFELEIRSTFAVRRRDITIMWKRHLINTPDSILELEHHGYKDQKRSLENEIILASSSRTLPTHDSRRSPLPMKRKRSTNEIPLPAIAAMTGLYAVLFPPDKPRRSSQSRRELLSRSYHHDTSTPEHSESEWSRDLLDRLR